MEWTNNVILEFLNNYEKNPVIWDPKNTAHKNRNEVRDAWDRIRENMSVDFSVETLKKKKESLMATYRFLRRKVIESSKNGKEDVHKPSWFAFETMDRFLNSTVKSTFTQDDAPAEDVEEHILNDEDGHEYEANEEFEYEEHRPGTTNTNAYETVVTKPVEHILRPPKRRRLIPRGGNVTKFEIAKCMKQASDVFKTISHHPPQQPEQPDECSLYAQLLAMKLRAMDKRTRAIVTNKIDNLIFNAEMCSLDSLPTTSYESFSEDSRQFSALIDDYSQTSVDIDVKSPSIMGSSLHTPHSTA